MATAKPTAKSQRITGHAIRERASRDHSPKWDGASTWTDAEFNTRFRSAMSYYNLNHSSKDLKPRVIDWMSRNDYSKDDIAAFKSTKDWRCAISMGAIATCLMRGMPAVHPGFNGGKDSSQWLRNSIAVAMKSGKNDIEQIAPTVVIKAPENVLSIQDRIREQAGIMSEEIDYAIDSWITDADAFDPKAFKMVSLLRGKGVKPAQARFIKGFYERDHDELLTLASGGADAQLKEAYQHQPRKNIRKLIEFYDSIKAACDQITAEAKVLKKPRVKKIKPAEDLIKRIKFKLTDDKLAITSVPPVSIIGAQGLVVFNTKTRKIGYYIANSIVGLTVKGTSIDQYSEKSVQKTLRKPAEQVKEFKEQTTQKRFEIWFNKTIKTTDTALNGRLGEDVVILKAFK